MGIADKCWHEAIVMTSYGTVRRYKQGPFERIDAPGLDLSGIRTVAELVKAILAWDSALAVLRPTDCLRGQINEESGTICLLNRGGPTSYVAFRYF